MPNPINPNLPLSLKGRKDGVADAAGYRLSLTLKEAANKIKASSRGQALKQAGWKCTSVLKEIVVERKRFRHKFNTNPWLGNAKGNGKEFTVEDQVWRLVSYSHDGGQADWFLAHHKGANNGFEFWHISDANDFRAKAIEAKPGTATPQAPSFTGKDIYDDQHGETQVVTTPKPATGATEVVDNWEDL